MEKINKVVYNPGNFGQFILRILEAQESDSIDAGKEMHSHDDIVQKKTNTEIVVQHPFDQSKQYDQTWIKPYFAKSQLKYFPFYCNYIKYLKPQNLFFDYKDFVRTYWNYEEPILQQNNLDMSLLFIDLESWLNQIEVVLRCRLKTHVRKFVELKLEKNRPLFDTFLHKHSMIDKCDVLLAIKVCEYIGNDKVRFNQIQDKLDSRDFLIKYVSSHKNI